MRESGVLSWLFLPSWSEFPQGVRPGWLLGEAVDVVNLFILFVAWSHVFRSNLPSRVAKTHLDNDACRQGLSNLLANDEPRTKPPTTLELNVGLVSETFRKMSRIWVGEWEKMRNSLPSFLAFPRKKFKWHFTRKKSSDQWRNRGGIVQQNSVHLIDLREAVNLWSKIEDAPQRWGTLQFGFTPHPRCKSPPRGVLHRITFLAGNAYKPSFVTVIGWGVRSKLY